MHDSSRYPLLLTTLMLWSLSCGRQESAQQNSLAAVPETPVAALSLEQPQAWEGTLTQRSESGSEAFSLKQDYVFRVTSAELRDETLSFVKIAGSSACAGESGLARTDYELQDESGNVLAKGTFHPLRRVYPLGARTSGTYRFRLDFAGPAVCSMSLRFALVTTADSFTR